MRNTLQDVESADLVDFANRWMSLGDAIASQVTELLANADSWEDQNANALRIAQERLGGMNGEIDEALDEALANFRRRARED